MSVIINYLCTYYPQWAHLNKAPRTQTLWDAYKFCKAVKSLEINGHCTVPTKGRATRIDGTNVAYARTLFAEYIRHVVGAEKLLSATLVPVPSKDSYEEENFRSYLMLKEGFGSVNSPAISPALRFTRQLEKASEGGTRGLSAIHPHLKADNAIRGQAVYLIDDILTTGGTMLASKQRLEEAGATVLGCIVCGWTDDDNGAPGFALSTTEILEVADHFRTFDEQ